MNSSTVIDSFDIKDPENTEWYRTEITMPPYLIRRFLDDGGLEKMFKSLLTNEVRLLVNLFNAEGYDLELVNQNNSLDSDKYSFVLKLTSLNRIIKYFTLECETDIKVLIDDILWKPKRTEWVKYNIMFSFSNFIDV